MCGTWMASIHALEVEPLKTNFACNPYPFFMISLLVDFDAMLSLLLGFESLYSDVTVLKSSHSTNFPLSDALFYSTSMSLTFELLVRLFTVSMEFSIFEFSENFLLNGE